MIKVDRSLFEAYQSALGQSVKILSHRADWPLIRMPQSAAWSENPWSGTIQGIPKEHAHSFIDYVASFVFKRQDTGHEWVCGFEETNLIDPFNRDPRTGWVALPTNRTLNRTATMSRLLDARGTISVILRASGQHG